MDKELDYEEIGENLADEYRNKEGYPAIRQGIRNMLNAVYDMTPLPEYFKWYNDPNYGITDALYDLQDKYVPFNSAYQNWRLGKDQDWQRNAIDLLFMGYPMAKGITKGTKALNAAYEAANPGRNAKSGAIAVQEELARMSPEEKANVLQAIRDINRTRQGNGKMALDEKFVHENPELYTGQDLANLNNVKRAGAHYGGQATLTGSLRNVNTRGIGLEDATDAAVVRHNFSNYDAANKAMNDQIFAWVKNGKIPGYSVKKVPINTKGDWSYHIMRTSDGALVNPHDEFKAYYNAQMEKLFPGYTKASETPNKKRRF